MTAGTFEGQEEVLKVVMMTVINSIDDSALSALKKMTSFQAGSTNLAEIREKTFAGATELTDIHLLKNRIDSIAANSFKHLTKLTQIVLSDNWLTTLPANLFSQAPELTWIDLQGNSIISIAALELPPKLHLLNISKNKITDLKLEKFADCKELKRLFILENKGDIELPAPDCREFSVHELKFSSIPFMEINEQQLTRGLRPFKSLEEVTVELQADLDVEGVCRELLKHMPKLTDVTINGHTQSTRIFQANQSPQHASTAGETIRSTKPKCSCKSFIDKITKPLKKGHKNDEVKPQGEKKKEKKNRH